MVLTPSVDRLATNTKAVERLNHLMGEIGTETTNFEVLIRDSTSQHFILGPSFKSASNSSNSYNRAFPNQRKEEFLLNNRNPDCYRRFQENNRLWPSYDPEWVYWLERVEDQKRYIWHQAGIYDVIQFSKYNIPFDRSLVLAALCYWSTSTNSFHFGHGPLTITLLDLSALVGLRPDGLQFDVLVANSVSIPDDQFGIEITKRSTFSSFIREHNNNEGVVTEEEHVAFLHFWLSRYLLRSLLYKMVLSNLPLAVALSRGESYALGPLVLANLYRSIYDLLDSQLGTAGGPLWIVQLWLHAYFPNLRPDCSPVPNLNCHGLKYVMFKKPEFSFHDCFLLYLSHLDKEDNFNYIPYSKSDALPPWLICPRSEMMETELSTIVDIWASFLVSRDLPVGVHCSKQRKKICGVEAYCPNLCARQFGLIQDIPTPPFWSFNTRLPERTVLESFEQLQGIKVTTAYLFNKLTIAPFSVLPSATSSFKTMWTKYYKQVFPEDLTCLLKLDDLIQSRPLRPSKPNEPTESNSNSLPPWNARRDALRKRKESTPQQTAGLRSYQLRVLPPAKRAKYMAPQAKGSSVSDGKEASHLTIFQCLRERGRAHSTKSVINKACNIQRSMIKGNYLSHAKSIEATAAKLSSSVSENGTTPPPKNQSQIEQGKFLDKRRINKEEVHCSLINLTKSSSLSHSEATEATFEKMAGHSQSKKQQPDALDKRDIVEITEDNTDSKLKVKYLPLTQVIDASNEKLPSRISSSSSQEIVELQLHREPSLQSPLHALSSHPYSPSKGSSSYHSRCHDKRALKMSNPLHSIRPLDFLQSYLLQHADAILVNTEVAPIRDSDLISQAKARIQSISTLSLDEVMEMECLQNLKSSLEIFLKADDQIQNETVENVQEKLGFVDSKYHLASAIAAEVKKEYDEKIGLEHEVEVCTHRFSEAQKEEMKFLTCIDVQKSILEELEKKLAEEKDILNKLEEFNAKQKSKMDELNCKLEHTQQLLLDHRIHERTRVMKAQQAKKDFESMEATWVQIQQLLSLIF